MKHIQLSGFAERLAYARLLVHFRTGRCVSQTEIAAAVDRTQPWVTKWSLSATPPRDYEVHRPLAAFLGVDVEWLIRGEGDPPEPSLWEHWVTTRAVSLVPHHEVRAVPRTAIAGHGQRKRR